jgi:hypothetical protein
MPGGWWNTFDRASRFFQEQDAREAMEEIQGV